MIGFIGATSEQLRSAVRVNPALSYSATKAAMTKKSAAELLFPGINDGGGSVASFTQAAAPVVEETSKRTLVIAGVAVVGLAAIGFVVLRKKKR